MTTNKPGITVYITDEIKVALEAYKSDRQHRSISAAVEVILKEFFGLRQGEFVRRAEIEPLIGKVESLSVVPDNAAELENRIERLEQAIAAATLKPEPSKAIAPHLTIDQAFEIARSRGYRADNKIASFRSGTGRKDDDCTDEYGLMRFKGSPGKRGQLLFADLRSSDSLKKSDAVPGQLAPI